MNRKSCTHLHARMDPVSCIVLNVDMVGFCSYLLIQVCEVIVMVVKLNLDAFGSVRESSAMPTDALGWKHAKPCSEIVSHPRDEQLLASVSSSASLA